MQANKSTIVVGAIIHAGNPGEFYEIVTKVKDDKYWADTYYDGIKEGNRRAFCNTRYWTDRWVIEIPKSRRFQNLYDKLCG